MLSTDFPYFHKDCPISVTTHNGTCIGVDFRDVFLVHLLPRDGHSNVHLLAGDGHSLVCSVLVSGGAARPLERDAARHVSTLDLLDLFEALFTILLYVNSVKTCRDAFLRLSKQDCRINRLLSRRLGSWLRRKNASLQFGNNRAAHIKWNSSNSGYYT